MNIVAYITRMMLSFRHPYPVRDWLFLLGISFLIFLSLIFYAGYLFFALQSGEIISRLGSGQTQITLTREKIESTLDIYRTRKVNFDAHSIQPSAVIDPALYTPDTPTKPNSKQ